ncbi:ArsR/SmtB family transcription factor [Phaeocystidibacter luteus]|uniref:Winged helix-turn-helix transcriptional regulator n=1 Tax=Phaeocystidibacter luteus TaxID=911197 RepID=A0A6N6RCV2_9FLAO|nr:metalloregulator ArsR/SmtB family transcription factor [Phaeocystidibacter luteus]KAB2805467.1 winged helix-turn-helix transcriptional regulator [Phaeocystidibacter luteus]
MGTSKTELFEKEQVAVAELCKALAHPARIAILEYLLKIEGCANRDLVEEVGLAQATVSQHLRELKRVQLVQGTVSGASMNYCVNVDGWKKAKTLIDNLLSQTPKSINNC